MNHGRRVFISLFPTAALGLASDKVVNLPSEAIRYADPSTENVVTRLTDPAHTSVLPAYYCRAVSRRGTSLFFSNDRTGEFQAYRMDVKTGQARQLTSAAKLDPATLNLMPDEKACCYVADETVSVLSLSSYHAREVYKLPEGSVCAAFAINDDGQYGTLIERHDQHYRLRLINFAKASATTIIEADEELSDPQPRPRRAGLLYRSGGKELHVVGFDGTQNQRLRTAAGTTGPALWSQDGRTVLYLNFPVNTPEEKRQLNAIREYTPDTNEDKPVAQTSQFVHFGRNADASVFVGASGSKASPYLLLLVRAVKRELTLCEHKASDPQLVSPVFSPNSQRVFFQTDRHGKLAIYTMPVDRLVEETE